MYKRLCLLLESVWEKDFTAGGVHHHHVTLGSNVGEKHSNMPAVLFCITCVTLGGLDRLSSWHHSQCACSRHLAARHVAKHKQPRKQAISLHTGSRKKKHSVVSCISGVMSVMDASGNNTQKRTKITKNNVPMSITINWLQSACV